MPARGKRFDDEQALVERLHSAAIRLLRRLRVADPSGGIGPAQLSVLSVLVFAGPRTPGELAQIEQVKPATMSRVLSALQAAELVRRSTTAGDARSSTMTATPRGRRLLLRIRDRRLELLAGILSGISPTERRQLEDAVAILERIISGRPAE